MKIIALELLEKYEVVKRIAIDDAFPGDESLLAELDVEIAAYRERIERRQAVDDAARRGYQGK